jgi:hypothetical protein
MMKNLTFVDILFIIVSLLSIGFAIYIGINAISTPNDDPAGWTQVAFNIFAALLGVMELVDRIQRKLNQPQIYLKIYTPQTRKPNPIDNNPFEYPTLGWYSTLIFGIFNSGKVPAKNIKINLEFPDNNSPLFMIKECHKDHEYASNVKRTNPGSFSGNLGTINPHNGFVEFGILPRIKKNQTRENDSRLQNVELVFRLQITGENIKPFSQEISLKFDPKQKHL